MDEQKEIDQISAGLAPFQYSSFGTGADDRRHSKYTWCDFFMNVNDVPFNCDTAVIVTSWYHHLQWLQATLPQYRKTGAFVILAFDNNAYIWEDIDNVEYMVARLPRPRHLLQTHAFVQKHKTYDADKRIGWFWNVRYSMSIIEKFPNIKYVYCTNGDCLFEKPEGLEEIKKILGDGDLIAGQSDTTTIHTACTLYKVEALKKIMEYMTTRLKHTVIGGQSPEGMLKDAVGLLGLKEVKAPVQPTLPDGSVDFYCTLNLPSTWKEVLGFRNLYAEQEHRTNNRMELLDRKYLDNFHNWVYYNNPEREMMCKYYETMDRRWLYMWWDRNCNSCEDRVYHPLEFYGENPIPEDGKNWG